MKIQYLYIIIIIILLAGLEVFINYGYYSVNEIKYEIVEEIIEEESNIIDKHLDAAQIKNICVSMIECNLDDTCITLFDSS